MNTLLRDLRYGLRTLMRNPAFAAVAVLTIGIGIGASTTIFSWMRPMLLNPLPGATHAERIVAPGSGFRSIGRIQLKMVVLAPIPIPIVRTATAAKAGFRISVRKP